MSGLEQGGWESPYQPKYQPMREPEARPQFSLPRNPTDSLDSKVAPFFPETIRFKQGETAKGQAWGREEAPEEPKDRILNLARDEGPDIEFTKHEAPITQPMAEPVEHYPNNNEKVYDSKEGAGYPRPFSNLKETSEIQDQIELKNEIFDKIKSDLNTTNESMRHTQAALKSLAERLEQLENRYRK